MTTTKPTIRRSSFRAPEAETPQPSENPATLEIGARRLRLVPFKVLALLMYGSYEWLTIAEDGLLEAKLPQMRRTIRVCSETLRGQLEWLQENNYIEELQLSRGRAKFRLRTPQSLVKQIEAERAVALEAVLKVAKLREALSDE